MNDCRMESLVMLFLVLQDLDIKVNRIVTMPESTFFYFFSSDDRYGDIELESDGTILAGTSDRKGDVRIWEVIPDAEHLAETVLKIRNYIQ